jgi:thioredoxin-related protein
MTSFYLFTRDSCGPCGLVKRYISALKDERSTVINEVYLEDFSGEPIPEKNLSLAKKYGVSKTPAFIIADPNGEILEFLDGGVNITQNITALWDRYV